MSDVIAEMNAVNNALASGDVATAEQTVMHSHVLPSSFFERVLRAGVATDKASEEYLSWCQRAYGKTQFVLLMADACMCEAPTERIERV